MAAEVVGGALLSATLQVVFDRLASHEVVDYFRGNKLSDELINNLKIVLLAINAVLDDAEEKQITKPNIKRWLDELEAACYEADDLLDEIATRALESKLEASGSRKSKRSKFFNSFCISRRSYNRDMRNKLEEILRRFKVFEKSINILGLTNKGVGEKPSPRSPTTSLIEESEFYGRDGDKEAIIKLLLEDDDKGGNKVSVIPIVGMGGIGKTTLAQSVYNNHKVLEHFNLKSWVYVSEDFDIFKVTGAVLSAVPKSHHSLPYDERELKERNLDSLQTQLEEGNLDSLQTELKERLMGKKFLIVLDDMWNEDYVDWKNISVPFKYGAPGSKIIVTTRSENVAKIMSTIPTHYQLKQLKDEDCWRLFKKHAFDNIRDDSSVRKVLETIGQQIVQKCNGLPLAAKTLGGLLRSKEDVSEWERILKSDIWDFSYKESKILPALMLSYHYLPSHLKRCFAFCSLFPKGYKFAKGRVILFWMAENLLQKSNKNKRMEDLGDEYFNELVSTSFLQRTSGQQLFGMHDLVHDLAKYVSRGHCIILEDDNSKDAIVNARHASVRYLDSTMRYDSVFTEATRLRTIFPLYLTSYRYLSNEVVNRAILNLRYVRVLSFHGCVTVKELSDSIGELKHLRFLRLSRTRIERLPKSVSKLYNLQVLNLRGCSYLNELPENMHHLINLRYLDINGCRSLVEMPRQMSKLKSLQTLTDFIVGEDNGTSIKELRELSDLHGQLCLQNLENVANASDASNAKLVDKKYLEALHLEWKGDHNDKKNDRDVLDNLLPHTNLKRLTVTGYGGTSFPDWLGDHTFSNILFLRLENCKCCNSLPPLGQLPSLENLQIHELNGVVNVGAEFYGFNASNNSVRKPFASLRILSFSNMSAWKSWSSIEVEEGGDVFHKLRELRIINCDRLTTVDWPRKLPCLAKFIIKGSSVGIVSSLPRTPALLMLKLGKCEKLKLEELSQTVQSVKVGGCNGVESLMKILKKSQSGSHRNLRCLHIHNCSSLTTLPEGYLPTTLTKLKIKNCEKLEFPKHQENSLKTLPLQSVFVRRSCGGSLVSFPLDFFPNLDSLHLQECDKLESLSVSSGQHHSLKSLSYLCIKECTNFTSFPNDGWHAPNLSTLVLHGCKKLMKLPKQMSIFLPSLKCLHIGGCPELESFPESGFPSTLMELSLANCSKLMAQRMKWNLRTFRSLTSFAIVDEFGIVESFPEKDLLPASLTVLGISGFPHLKRLEELQHLTSLKNLRIWRCPRLQDLPQQGFPTSLTYLDIRECPILKERCQIGKGQDWNIISNIFRIYIDGDRIV